MGNKGNSAERADREGETESVTIENKGRVGVNEKCWLYTENWRVN